MQTKVYIEGNKVIFNCEGNEFVREIDKLKKQTGTATVSELMDKICQALKAEPSEEQVRDEFGAGIEDAVLLATECFYGQKDLDGEPKFFHALEVGRAGKTKDEKIVGYIHDVVEDTDLTFDDLARMGFTKRVLEAAKLCTRDRSVPYEDYLKEILASGNKTALHVKMNDLHHNLSRGEKTAKKAAKDGNQKLLDRISTINTKHEGGLKLIKSK